MASVYRATDELLTRDVAIKIFQASATNQEEISRQENELKVLASLTHHSLVTLLDAGVDLTDPEEPHLYLVIELLDGSDLRHKLSAGPLSARQVAEIGYDLAEGLEYIHHSGIVHRDIKPANILMVDYGSDDPRLHAKLTDFGIAMLSDSRRIADATSTTGTAAYLSPEQARGDSIGPASDIYSLGLVLIECLTGEMVFPGQPTQSALARLLADPAVPADLAPEFRELLIAMTAREPADRPLVRDIVLSLRQAMLSEAGKHKEPDSVTVLENERARMEEVARYEILDTPPDGAFDRITALAARLFAVPVAIVSVVDHDRIWFKSHHGLHIDQVERAPGLCASAVLQDGPWVVEEARKDPRALANPLVASDFGLQFYAGVPLRTKEGHNLGTLCVLDFEPRPVTTEEIATLEDLAAVVMSGLELRLAARV